MFKFTTVFTALLIVASSAVNATPVAPVARAALEVCTPQILVPVKDSMWISGTQQTVQWDTTSLSDFCKDQTGNLFLGHPDETGNEHLSLNKTLATVNLADGSASVTVPGGSDLESGTASGYVVVLIGDSGNISPTFTIVDPSSAIPSASAL